MAEPTPVPNQDGTLQLDCLIKGESTVFVVPVGRNNVVSNLKESIQSKQALGSLKDVGPHTLELWKPKDSNLITAKPADTLVECINSLGDDLSEFAVELEAVDNIFDIFPTQPPRDCIHIIVKVPHTKNESLDGVHDRGMKRRLEELGDLITERELLSKIVKYSPSSFAKLKPFAQPVVDCNRSFDFDTIPITLLQEEFGLFMDDCKVLPSPKSQELLQALTVAACKVHENEPQRRSEIQKVLHNVADLPAETIAGTEYKTDGNLRVNIMPPVIREYVPCTTAFCILLVDTGSYFGLYGCLWTAEHLHVEPLTPLYDLTIHWKDEDGRQAIAASLDAFLKAIPRLEAHYAQVASIPYHSLPDRTYPYKTSYEDENGQHINFSYRLRIADKLIFVAKPDKSGDKDLGTLCVKFTRRYSEDAHRFLAQLGYAPRLRAVMRLPGGWIMVVMDYSEYTQLCDLLQISDELRHTITAKVSDIVQELHGAGFVHGDIRSTNLLVDRRTLTSKDGIKIHFIDFDWAGRQGEAVYPMRINKVTVWRPEGASDGKPILVEHDLAMVNSLL